MPLNLLRLLSLLIAVPLLVVARTLYRIPWLGPRLPYSNYLRWLAPFSLHKVHAIVLDHAVTPVSHYMSRADVLNMVSRTDWTIDALDHNRAMSWGFCAVHCNAGHQGPSNMPVHRDLANDSGQISSQAS
jgi:hypothetical protein